MRTLYFALVNSYLSYGIIAWGNADKAVIRSLTLLQKRAIRIIYNAPFNSHTDPKFKNSGILKLQDMFEYQSLLLVYDYLSANLPKSFDGIFPTNSDMPNSRSTRQSQLLYVPRFSSKYAKKQPIYFLPVLWNEWVKRIPVTGSKYQVKRYIKTTLLQHYSSEVICSNERCTECGPE